MSGGSAGRRGRPQAGGEAQALEERLGHRFRHPGLLERALTHRSAVQVAGSRLSNETLEFLGDAILGFLTADSLERAAPERTEGELSRLRAALVRAPTLAAVAREIGLGDCLRLGAGEERGGGRDKESILADACEAVIGAVYRDAGLTAARRLVARLLGSRLRQLLDASDAQLDAKTRLQERLQAGGGVPPVYRVVESRGPDHAPRYRVEVRHAGRTLGRGEGRSKRAAEREAARHALRTLETAGPGRTPG